MLISKAKAILDEMAFKFLNTFSPTKLVVGLSGGADSTLVLLLAHHIRKLNKNFSVKAVHCVHGLDADDPIWFDHCTLLCEKLDIEISTPKLHIVYGNGVSPEDSSRKERYSALLKESKDGILMLGHQSDDQVENFLLALKRGSGPYGLSGMRYCIRDSRGIIVRPLLHLTKDEIIEIINALGFDYVFDISNTYMKFERNFMRLKVLPLLRERFSGIDNAILRSQKLCAYEHDLAARYASSIFKPLYDEKSASLDFSTLNLDDESLITYVMRLFISEYTLMPPELNTVLEAINLCRISNDQLALVKLEDDLFLKRYKKKLYVVKNTQKPQKGEYVLSLGEKIKLGDYTYELYVDMSNEKITSASVVLDFNYSKSIVVHPEKRAHSRDIGKLFGEFCIPVWNRDIYPLIRSVNNKDIILGLGDLFVTRECKNSEYSSLRLKISAV
ncbi:tRNA lysidine(34) synthetase TilS [Succinivibrio sp.]|uniref:tRNA lysidine(34) synthetase TilS n=1 Tax=Succinivibrio sp. TaxID=2053619 RepID=UPI00258581A1|nr:tRNA lysidine(34) synthetase TilS [Succinivibrio sp.]MDD6205939.1 tRNA lysidine(34) synthetase TilS [Succinivibrio sp.]